MPIYYRLNPLNKEQISHWASKANWTVHEALILSMLSYSNAPEDSDDYPLYKDKEKSSGEELELRKDLLNRADQMELIKIHDVKCIDSDYSNAIQKVVIPAEFVKWAIKGLPSISEELCEEVIKRQSNTKQDKPENGKGGNPGSDAKWGLQREIIAKAEKYVKKALQDGCEYCDHRQLADFMYNNASDENGKTLFEYPDIEESTLLEYLKRGAKSALEKTPERIVGNKGYKKSDGLCEIHTAKK